MKILHGLINIFIVIAKEVFEITAKKKPDPEK